MSRRLHRYDADLRDGGLRTVTTVTLAAGALAAMAAGALAVELPSAGDQPTGAATPSTSSTQSLNGTPQQPDANQNPLLQNPRRGTTARGSGGASR